MSSLSIRFHNNPTISGYPAKHSCARDSGAGGCAMRDAASNRRSVRMDSTVRHRIDMLRFLMIFGVVVLHTPEYVAITLVGDDFFSLTKAFFQNAMFRTAVPMLTLISGYLVFHSGIDQLPCKLAAKKARSLLVPFLVFNLPLVLLVAMAELFTSLQTNYRLVPFDAATWCDAMFGLLHSPINYPLNFLRDMLVLMCLAPGMGWLMRRTPTLGFAFVAVVFLNDVDGSLVLRNLMPVLFYVGGVAARYRWNLRALDRFALPCAVVFLLLCAGVVHFRIADMNMLRLVSPLLVWPASLLLLGTRVGDLCIRLNRYSFFLFVAHAPVLFGTWLVYKHAGSGIPYPLYWMTAPVLTTAILVLLYHAGMRIAPDVLSIALGGRGGRRAASGATLVPQPALQPLTLAVDPIADLALSVDALQRAR
jgi:succinoglycan biosynthesis protein ExoH